MTYYYKKVGTCQIFNNGDLDPDYLEYIATCKEMYNSGSNVDFSWLICNSKTGKCITIDLSLWAGHSIVLRHIKRNPNLITDEEFMDYDNNPFRRVGVVGPKYQPVQTTKLKGKYEKLYSRS